MPCHAMPCHVMSCHINKVRVYRRRSVRSMRVVGRFPMDVPLGSSEGILLFVGYIMRLYLYKYAGR